MGHTHHAPSAWTLPATHARSAWSYTHAHVCTHLARVHTTHTVWTLAVVALLVETHTRTSVSIVCTPCTLTLELCCYVWCVLHTWAHTPMMSTHAHCVPSGAHIHMTACTSLIFNVHPHTHTHTDFRTVTRRHTAIYLERATRCTILLFSCMCG